LKIPVPFLFVFSAFLGAVIFTRRWRWLLWPHVWLATLLSIVPVAIWTWLLIQRIGWDHVSSVWIHEAKIHSETPTGLDGGPPWFYVGPMIAYFAPWCLLYPILFMRKFHRAQKDRLTFHFLWAGVALPLLFLSFNSAKQSDYQVSMMALLSVLLARAYFFARENFSIPIVRVATRRVVLATLIGGMCVFMWAIHPLAEMRYFKLRTPKATVQKTLEIAQRDQRPIIYYEINDPKLYFYVRRIVKNYDSTEGDQMAVFLREHPNAIVFGESDTMKKFETRFPEMQFRDLMETPAKLRQTPYELVASPGAATAQ
ncbi:MAG: hypothetical protein ABI579_02580, partial [Candidatus Sumerlaeota bacterium]